MRVYKTSFRKKTGDIREMVYVELKDLPKDMLFLKSEGQEAAKKVLPEGMKLVWDVENWNYRVINENQLMGEIEMIDFLSLEGVKERYKKQ